MTDSPDEPQTPRVDREVYRVSARDIGFEVVNPALARQLELELIGSRRIIDEMGVELRMAQEDAARYRWLRETMPMTIGSALNQHDYDVFDAKIDAAIQGRLDHAQ